MATEDKQKWNAKHQKDEMPHTPLKIVTDYAPLAHKGKALDIACGNGRHAKWLVKQGFEVDALDISDVAIKKLQDIERINAKEVDFDTFELSKDQYDLVVKTYFLHRPLFAQIKEAMRPGGIIILETFMHHPDNEREPSNPAFRLFEGELELYFSDGFEILHHDIFWDKDYMGYKTLKVQLVAKREEEG